MASRQLAALDLSEEEGAEQRSLAARRNTAQALALRARIVLASAAGAQNKQVAAHLQVDPATVGKWRQRFVEHRLDGLRDEPRSGAPRTIEDARIEAVIVRTLESVPSGHTLEFARHVAGLRPVGFHGPADLARLRPAAASPGEFQALHRP